MSDVSTAQINCLVVVPSQITPHSRFRALETIASLFGLSLPKTER
ncbi:hypothetical protein GCM10007392_26300 [Saccharospirillum salsuginis]|uniref:Uncharacterized protein n=1 Tax=Saccharospirillum salsuginis TaxID=418750 RepID=A0A918KB23_9GAMM|nr:hypothetical protein GCM10007392_26300 [Saccharospirillum salsuginis]